MVHVEDVCDAAIAVVTHEELSGRVYLVTDGQAYAPPAIQAAMCAALGRPLPRLVLSPWMLRLAAAAADYGVVIGTDPWVVDVAGTEAKRAAFRTARGDSDLADVAWTDAPGGGKAVPES